MDAIRERVPRATGGQTSEELQTAMPARPKGRQNTWQQSQTNRSELVTGLLGTSTEDCRKVGCGDKLGVVEEN